MKHSTISLLALPYTWKRKEEKKNVPETDDHMGAILLPTLVHLSFSAVLEQDTHLYRERSQFRDPFPSSYGLLFNSRK